MPRKKSALIDYRRESLGWCLTVRSTDTALRANLIDVIEESEKRGLQIINSTDPFAGIEAKPRKVRRKKSVNEADCQGCGLPKIDCTCKLP